MEYLGKWKVKKMVYPTEEGAKFFTKEEILATGNVDPSDLNIFNSVYDIKEDGTIATLVEVPAELLDEAKATGAPVDENGFLFVEQTSWKEENGVYLYEMNGDFIPFKLNDEGLLEYTMGMMLLEKL